MSDKMNQVEHLEIDIVSGKADLNQTPASIKPPSMNNQGFNALPLAFCGFSIGSILLGFVNTGLVTNVNAVAVGSCIASAGLGLAIGSISELFKGEVFTGTSMGVYAGFYFAYGILFIPSVGFTGLAEQQGGMREMQICGALFSMVYAVPALLFFLGTLKQPWLVRILMFQVTVSFFCSGIGNAIGSSTVIAVSGWFSITLGLTAWYMMAAMLYTYESTYFVLPVF